MRNVWENVRGEIFARTLKPPEERTTAIGRMIVQCESAGERTIMEELEA